MDFDVSCPGFYTHFMVSLEVYGLQCVSTGILALVQGSYELAAQGSVVYVGLIKDRSPAGTTVAASS